MIALVLSFAACKGSQQAADRIETPVNTEADRPEWVRSRPITDQYYIGVGRSSKALPEPYETAKKNALNELASEISVIVEGNSLLHSIESRQRFDESFTSTIKMRTSEQLEGFELVDSWENDKEYWVYYRLSKAEHARLKAEKKARALGNAKDLHFRSKESLATGDLRSTFDQLLRGLLAMKEYWGENDLVEVDGRQVPLANEMFNDLQKLTSSVHFSALPERCVLDLAGGGHHHLLRAVVGAQVIPQRGAVQPAHGAALAQHRAAQRALARDITARTHGEDHAPLRLFAGRIGNVNATGGLLGFIQHFQHHPIAERLDVDLRFSRRHRWNLLNYLIHLEYYP